MDGIGAALHDGAIGTLREVHNWLDKPIWPQGSPTLPKSEPVPEGLDWDLWLGPVPNRPYAHAFTHAVFRGWYDFGSGCLADMGHYSLWPVYRVLGLGVPAVVEAAPSFTCAVGDDGVSRKQHNDVSFPHASTIRFHHPARDAQPALDVFWYDGGMRPATPRALFDVGQTLAPSGMMFVGDDGIIVGSFHGNNPQVYARGKRKPNALKTPATGDHARGEEWITALREGRRSQGDFLHAQAISETICLGNVALRVGGRIEWDAERLVISNNADANTYLTREYRPGWEL
jgi:hypothetical protein